MQELRGSAAATDCARAQVSSLRERLLKLGAWVQRSVRRIVLHLPQYAPWRSDGCRVARCLGAAPRQALIAYRYHRLLTRGSGSVRPQSPIIAGNLQEWL
jgi:hypothetical protein